ncbi:hypothetical protein TELCIR_19360, partial [Teladorsagia circumcincta]
LTDFASMLISLFSVYIATKPPSQRMSFGFHRAEVLGAFFSVFMIWIVTGVLVVLAILRIANADYEIDATIMAITAAIGVLVNLIRQTCKAFHGDALRVASSKTPVTVACALNVDYLFTAN